MIASDLTRGMLITFLAFTSHLGQIYKSVLHQNGIELLHSRSKTRAAP
jgi:hypothetical protein